MQEIEFFVSVLVVVTWSLSIEALVVVVVSVVVCVAAIALKIETVEGFEVVVAVSEVVFALVIVALPWVWPSGRLPLLYELVWLHRNSHLQSPIDPLPPRPQSRLRPLRTDILRHPRRLCSGTKLFVFWVRFPAFATRFGSLSYNHAQSPRVPYLEDTVYTNEEYHRCETCAVFLRWLFVWDTLCSESRI